MEKIWLNQYPPDVPTEINPDTYSSIVAMIDEAVAQHADRPAFYLLGRTMTFRELDVNSRALAAYFQQILKLQKGDRLAIILPNILQYPLVLMGALRAGLIVVNVNPLYTADELAFRLNDAEVKATVIFSHVAHILEKALPHLAFQPAIIVTDMLDLHPFARRCLMAAAMKLMHPTPKWRLPYVAFFNQALTQGRALALQPVELTKEDIAFLQYTGGTTGIVKGAILTHRNMIANLLQVRAWFNQKLQPGREIVITALPLYHIFSLLGNCLLFMSTGGLNVLIINPRDIPSMLKEMKKFKFTIMTGVNTLFAALLKNPAFKRLDFSHLHFVFGGGMAVQQVTAEQWQSVTHFPLLEGYGLTEASPCVTVNPYTLKEYNGSIGLPLPSTDVIFLDNGGVEVPRGEIGELGIKGPQVMRGYWHHPLETKNAFTKEGWFLTGDMGVMDKEGFIRIVERKKEMILVSGFNVYPLEIETVLMMLPGLKECAVVGIPDEQTGEAIKAFIVADDKSLTKDMIENHCRVHLTPYKIPKSIVFINELPKSNIGKVLRRKLRELVV